MEQTKDVHWHTVPEVDAVTVADRLLLKDMRRHTRVPHSGNSVYILHGVHG
jgi:hypothetical protein